MAKQNKKKSAVIKTTAQPRLRLAYSYDESRERWDETLRFANGISIDRSQNLTTRRILRNKAREEVMNNAWAYGAGQTLVSSVVGSGGRLQLIPEDSGKRVAKLCQRIERDYMKWAEEVRLGEKLRAMRFSKFQDGEAFAIFYTNDSLESSVKLDIYPIDCDRVTASGGITAQKSEEDDYLDGVNLDEFGNPVSYRILQSHPGGYSTSLVSEVKEYKAEDVLHWYKRMTSEQHRGIPEITPALNLFNAMRRYTKATVIAAETAAEISFVITTDSSDGNSGDEIQELRVTPGLGLLFPEGFNLKQLEAKQPSQNFGELIDQLLGQIGACLGLPRLIMRKSAIGFNYAGARVDLQAYSKFVALEQAELSNRILKPIFRRWFKEYRLANSIVRPLNLPVHPTFFFDGDDPVDPQKEAKATQTKLECNLTTLSQEYAKVGVDWEEALRQRAKELSRIKELEGEFGISFNQDDSVNGENEDGNSVEPENGGEDIEL